MFHIGEKRHFQGRQSPLKVLELEKPMMTDLGIDLECSAIGFTAETNLFFLKLWCLSVLLRSIWLFAHKKKSFRFSNSVPSRHPETMAHRKGLSTDEIANLIRDISENESDGGELSYSNLYSDEDMILSENVCEESEENADI
ncbi:hypothetical protein TNCV_3130941 [Trichonephila clavipes]|nr:hypothetical protein TNCV_3130941 [Trichonephila clavipes]